MIFDELPPPGDEEQARDRIDVENSPLFAMSSCKPGWVVYEMAGNFAWCTTDVARALGRELLRAANEDRSP